MRIFTENNPDIVYENPEEIRNHWIEFIVKEFAEEIIDDLDMLKIMLDA